MAFSVQGSLLVRRADGTDFAAPDARVYSASIAATTDTEFFHDLLVDASDAPLDLSELIPATVQGLVVENLSSTSEEDVTVTYGSNTVVVGPGDSFGVFGADFDTTLTLDAASGTPKCRVLLWGV